MDVGADPAADEAEHLLRPADLPAGLTAREVEVLRLAVDPLGSAGVTAAYAFGHGLV